MNHPFLTIPEKSDFSIHNIPFGIFSHLGRSPRVGIAIGIHVLDLKTLAKEKLFPSEDYPLEVFAAPQLNDFISLGKKLTSRARLIIQEFIKDTEHPLWKDRNEFVVEQDEVDMYLPVTIGDYTDFYSSIEHATNVGVMFRGKENALMPNWKHLPVGYHGRASSIVVSGTPVQRPHGQKLPPNATKPIFGASSRLDIELEMGFIVGKESYLGDSIPIEDAEDYIFGMTLFNDWSARDIQKWEYVPLGPFLGKSFCSSMSPWVVTMEALEPFRVAGPKKDVELLPYLEEKGKYNYDINLGVELIDEKGTKTTISESNFKYMYWSMNQQLSHHTINGCNVKVGDYMASGTISGKDKSAYGSLLELSWGGKEEITLSDGSTRTFLEDNDSIKITGFALHDDVRVGFGEVIGKVLPAKKIK